MLAKQNSLSEQEQNVLILKELAANGTFAEYCIAIDQLPTRVVSSRDSHEVAAWL
jgi:hypothetical protein